MTKTVFISNGKPFNHAGEPLEVKVEAKTDTTGTALPDGFPERDLLVGSEFKTLEALKGATAAQLEAIDGIGPAKAKAILAALK